MVLYFINTSFSSFSAKHYETTVFSVAPQPSHNKRFINIHYILTHPQCTPFQQQ